MEKELSSPVIKKGPVDRFIHIAQGAAGILEDGCLATGLYTDKIATCRPYVFVCQGGTIMIHDTGQIQLDAIAELVSNYGKIKAIHFVEGPQREAEAVHKERLLRLAQRLQFKRGVFRTATAYIPGYNVFFTQSGGLRIGVLPDEQLIRDPQHQLREGVNMINDTFTTAGSQTAPLDVQYIAGGFTPSSVPAKTVPMMLDEALVDGNRRADLGLIDIAALYSYMPGNELPEPFLTFVREHDLESLVKSPIRKPSWYGDLAKQAEVFAKFKELPIFS